MRRAIAVILSGVLVTTPIKVVLAQARESQVASTRIQAPARIGVPVVEPNSGSALLFTVGQRDHTLAHESQTLSPPPRRVSTADKVVLLVVGLVVALAVIVVIAKPGPTGFPGVSQLKGGIALPSTVPH